jgi:hypothetical protein
VQSLLRLIYYRDEEIVIIIHGKSSRVTEHMREYSYCWKEKRYCISRYIYIYIVHAVSVYI